MLRATEFFSDTFANANFGSFILLQDERVNAVIIGEYKDVSHAVVLDGRFVHYSFPSQGNENWEGVIIPGIRIEVDQSSFVDPRNGGIPLGSIVRDGTSMLVRAKDERGISRISVVVQKDCPACPVPVAFTRWEIVIGEGVERRVIWKADAQETAT